MQKKYALDLLRHDGMLECHSMLTPMTSTENITSSNGDLLSSEDATTYRSIVGGLKYLILTHPDLSFGVNKVCQYLHASRSSHWSAVYVHFTLSHGLHIRADSSSLLSTFFLMLIGLATLMIGDLRRDMPYSMASI
jgi:histone deacetylase 1/2